MWHGQLSPRFKFNKLKSFSGVEIDQNHVDKRILGGKGFAVGRLKRHNFCPASVCICMIVQYRNYLPVNVSFDRYIVYLHLCHLFAMRLRCLGQVDRPTPLHHSGDFMGTASKVRFQAPKQPLK